MKKLQTLLCALALSALLAGCAPVTSGACMACVTGHAAIETRLYFGLSTPQGAVTRREWDSFVRREITPRFPEGFTVVEGRGFWRNETSGRTISEDSKVLIRIHDAGTKDDAAIAAIIARYKKDFAQESVLRVDAPVCAAF